MSDMMLYDIEDNEIRIVGQKISSKEKHKKHRNYFLWIVIMLALLSLIFFMLLFIYNRGKRTKNTVYREESIVDTNQYLKTIDAKTPNIEENIYTIVTNCNVNDIPLRLLTPTGGHIELIVDSLNTDDKSIILAAQAADHRADNGNISGAFVYKGELLSRGHPKYGFCTIIGDEVTMGMSPETPLFERAVEKSGYFFRQFSLVHDGKIGESTPTGKSIRRALCYDGERISIVETEDRESFHDFSQALIDIGIKEAISLVGNNILPIYEDEQGNRIVSDLSHKKNATVTYIVWKK